jgi:hypothetical protein
VMPTGCSSDGAIQGYINGDFSLLHGWRVRDHRTKTRPASCLTDTTPGSPFMPRCILRRSLAEQDERAVSVHEAQLDDSNGDGAGVVRFIT